MAGGARVGVVAAALSCLVVRPVTSLLRAPGATPGTPLGDIFDRVRFSVVRIEAISADIDWFRPYRPGEDRGVTGSGFAVSLGPAEGGEGEQEEGPLFVTNAHVVRNAHHVIVKMPAIGQDKFTAFVPVICEDFDIALVRLVEPAKFNEAMVASNASVKPFHIQENVRDIVAMGLTVVAVGFPLGSSTLKLGTGIISGTEQTGTRTRSIICYQSTAPISPGSSGGPLLALDGSGSYQVIGVNYASASSTQAQNTNYVLPAVHILPVLQELTRQGRLQPGRIFHVQLRFAPIDATLIESNGALYNSSGGCKSGIYVSDMSPWSVLAFAEPPIPKQSFIVAVNDIVVDSFGMGRSAGFLGHPVPLGSIMTSRADLGRNVSLDVCHDGRSSEHAVSMRWRSEYDLGIRTVLEPYFEKKLLDYEVFAGVTFMRMTLNHVYKLLKDCTSWGTCTMGRWLMARNNVAPRLMVANVKQGTYAYQVLAEGMTVQSVNGHSVTSLDDFRNHFVPEGFVWTLRTDRGITFQVRFREALSTQLFDAWSSPVNRYLLTPAVKAAVGDSEKLGAAVRAQSVSNQTGQSTIQAAREAGGSGGNRGAAPTTFLARGRE